MKTITYSLILAALAATGSAIAQDTAYTTPVGYETLRLAPGQFNIIGKRLFNPPVASGTFETSTPATLVDNEAAFNLEPATNYIIESAAGGIVITSGASFSGTTVSGLSGITPSFQGKYVVRVAETVSSIFGAANQAGLASSANADPTEADLILIPNGSGFTRVFYSTFADDPAFQGWLDADTFDKVSDELIDPSQGLFVQTAISTSPIDLVISGEVKTTPTAFVVDNTFTLLGGVYPAGATLATSGISNYLQKSPNADPTEADNILLPDGAGGFVRAFFSTFADDPEFAGWLNSDTFDKIPNQEITSGFFVNKIGPSFTGLNTPPASYDTL
jgi:hypothetical protein